LFNGVVLRFSLFVLRVLLWLVVSAFLSGFEDKVFIYLFFSVLFICVLFLAFIFLAVGYFGLP